jgi:hypothetical protein
MPNIIHAGRVKFNQRGAVGVTFLKPVPGDYFVTVTGDGANGGAMAKSIETFAVVKRTSAGFVIECANNNSRATVDYIVVAP